MENFISNILDFGLNIGYPGIIILMAIESSFFPLPSEVVIPPFAYLAQQGEMNIFLVVLAGSFGSVLGAVFNYFLGKIIGQAVVYKLADSKFAKLLLINSDKLKKAETFFLKSANQATFLGRLIPGIRHLISIPAGFFKMNFKNFLFYTFIGSFLWCSILSFLGYFFGANQDALLKYYKEISLSLGFVGVCLLIYFYFKKNKKSKI